MPDLLEPADSSRRHRDVVVLASPPAAAPASDFVPAMAESTPSRDEPIVPADGTTSLEPVLLFDKVSKWYGPVIGVNQISLELRPGITGLVGANGSGKSTLLRLAAGHLRPDLGSVRICGQPAWNAAGKRHVGYCPELDTFYEEMSGRGFIETMARLTGYTYREARRLAAHTLDLVGMSGRAERCLAGYSKGMRQRIKLAQALLHDPELLLLDEPLSGIDPIGRRESIDLFMKLAERGKCLLVSSHELEELEKLTDRVAILAYGRIAAVGPVTQIRDLLDSHPLSIRVSCLQNRRLAALLLELDEVVGLDMDGPDYLLVRARQPRRFFRRLSDLVLEEDLELRHLETLDDSTHAILGYLLGGRQ